MREIRAGFLARWIGEAADQLRANSKLTSSEYCMPVLGVIFLRHASNRYEKALASIKLLSPANGIVVYNDPGYFFGGYTLLPGRVVYVGMTLLLPELVGTEAAILPESYIDGFGDPDPLTQEMIGKMEGTSANEVDQAFREKFRGSDIAYGKNLLFVNLAKLLVRKFLKTEKAKLYALQSARKQLTIKFIDQYFEKNIMIGYEGGSLEVRMKGFVDRAETQGNLWRIIDYKTGAVPKCWY